MNQITKRILFVGALFVALGALAYPKVKPLFTDSNTANSAAASARSALQVDAVRVGTDSVEDKIFTTGTLLANEEVELSSEISGKITDIYLEEGRNVKQGQLLLKINDSELQAQLTRAQYRLNLATERESRQEKLLEKGGISQEDYDATLNEVNVLKSEVALIKAQIEKTEIRAPFNGRVGLKYVSEGSYISPTTRIASLQSINPIKLDFSIPERYVNTVEVGDRITFTVQGTDREFQGEIYAIEPRINSQTRTLQIRARSNNDEGLLVPGAFADIKLVLDTIDDALMLPTIALVPEIQGQKVFMYSNGQVMEQRV
ncbi:efflux RND transporter periplasmic adaptor subunit [Aliifodinibius sp. S!AR15-10]|uniref:efflux RND transporter periplasmic adaptor subunit n=1 Tax=Aliifodinibius sp. S!AR15-10 TaxID=2950437 RepID=UPI00285BF94A|nr:efflux RND transporter periplasmic adaptor subunit [Aliifodinibius sp. S!AR15-10]MDR8392772.1 efflux RND transporter periplasmic adaptor subunit [Aliifodinibius sp. S!AR15-10]